jgi:hypothetical protein
MNWMEKKAPMPDHLKKRFESVQNRADKIARKKKALEELES